MNYRKKDTFYLVDTNIKYMFYSPANILIINILMFAGNINLDSDLFH